MWIYGIKLFLTESTKEAEPSAFNYIIQAFLSNTSHDKMRLEVKKRTVFDKQKTMRDDENETHASSSKYNECVNEIGKSNNEKEFPNCGDNYKQSNATECKNGITKGDSGPENLNYEEKCKRSDTDEKICIVNNTESVKKKSGIFNSEDFVQTFFSNASKMSKEPDMTRIFEFYDKFNDNEIMNNEQFYQKISGILSSDSDFLGCKNKIAKGDNGKDRRSCEADEKSDSFECKNSNIRNSDEKCENGAHENYKKSDIDIRIYIDNKFHDMEKRLMERLEEIEAATNQKLDAILEKLG